MSVFYLLKEFPRENTGQIIFIVSVTRSQLISCIVEILEPKTLLQLKNKDQSPQRDHSGAEHEKHLPHLQGEPVW